MNAPPQAHADGASTVTYNPYAPPEFSPAAARPSPDVRLFGPVTIAAHAVLLTPLIASIMAATNRLRLGQRAELRRTMFVYVAPSAALILVTLIAPRPLASLFRAFTLAWSVEVA
ncbi:MAG TPA: hypothetical protein VIY73_13450, partial [Polyangiaceae bacterium]